MEKLGVYFEKELFSSYKKTVGLLIVVAVAIALPITVGLLENRQTPTTQAQTSSLVCKPPDPIPCKVHLAVPPRDYPQIASKNQKIYNRGPEGKALNWGYCSGWLYKDDIIGGTGTQNDHDIFQPSASTCLSSYRMRVIYNLAKFPGVYGQQGMRSRWNYLMAEVKAGWTDFGLAYSYDEDMNFIANQYFGMGFEALKASEEKNDCSMDAWNSVCRNTGGPENDNVLEVRCKGGSFCVEDDTSGYRPTDENPEPPPFACSNYNPSGDKSTPGLAPPAEVPEPEILNSSPQCLIPLAIPPKGISDISRTKSPCPPADPDIYSGGVGSTCWIDFRIRVNYLKTGQYVSYTKQFPFYGARITWNYLMAEVKTGMTNFGLSPRTWEEDMDYVSNSFFGKTFAQLKADEVKNGCQMDSWRFVCRTDKGATYTGSTCGTLCGKPKVGIRFAGCRNAGAEGCLSERDGRTDDNPPRMICDNYRKTCECTGTPVVCRVALTPMSATSLNAKIEVLEGDLCGYDFVDWYLDGPLKGTEPINTDVLFQDLEPGSTHAVKGTLFSSTGAREPLECGVTSSTLGSTPPPPTPTTNPTLVPGPLCAIHLAVPPRNISIIDRRNLSITDPSKWFPEYCSNKQKDVFQIGSTGLCRSGFRERIAYVSTFGQYGSNGLRVKWNYIMSEVRTGYTDFGLAQTYEQHLDDISKALFGMTFQQVVDKENASGCSMDSFPSVCRTTQGGRHPLMLPDGCPGSVCRGTAMSGWSLTNPPPMVCANYKPAPVATPTLEPGGTGVSLSLQLSGVGASEQSGNLAVSSSTVDATVQVFSTTTASGLIQKVFAQEESSGQLVKEVAGKLNYDGKVFRGTVSLGTNIPDGNYYFVVKMPSTLSMRVPGEFALSKNQVTNLPNVVMTSGDLNNDDSLSIDDWNVFVSCYGEKTCSEKSQSDLNFDREVTIIDGNILIRSFEKQQVSP